MKKTVCTLLLLSFFLSTSFSANFYNFYSKKFISDERLEYILKDVSLLTLGSLGNLSLIIDVGKYVGAHVKNQGYAYYIMGPIDSLSIDDEDYFYRVNKSPFITADVYEKFATGLSIAGVVPVFDGRGKIDTNLVSSLITRKLTYPVIVESSGKANLLRNLGYTGVFILETSDGYEFLNGRYTPLYWSISLPNGESIRRNVLLNSIIYISQGDIKIKKPFSNNGIVVFSDEEFVIEEAKKILGKKAGPGRIPW